MAAPKFSNLTIKIGNKDISISYNFVSRIEISRVVSDAANKYATITALQNLQSQVDTLSADTSSTYAKVFVGNSTPSNPKNGDIWVNV